MLLSVFMPLPQKGLRVSEEETRKTMKEVMKKWTWQKNVEEDEFLKYPEERTQDFLMPGLRHAHTLQQLRVFVEYSPPGEYLNKQNLQRPTKNKPKELK